MKKKLLSLILSLALIGGCSSSSANDNQNNEIKQENNMSETADAESLNQDNVLEVEDASTLNQNSETELGSYDWFVNVFLKNIENDIPLTNSNTSNALNTIEENFSYLYYVDFFTFDPDSEENTWYYELGVYFAYFYNYFEKDTNGYSLGETGLKTLYALLTIDKTEFDKNIEKLKTMCEEAGLSIETEVISGKVNAGKYKVGLDLESGEYVVFAADNRRGYYSVCSDPNGSNILFNDNISYNSYITIEDGEYLELSNAYAIPLSENEIEIDTTDEGMFKVGKDIPAGEYKLIANSGRGYYCIYQSSRHDKIISNDNFTNQTYVSVTDGQYLELVRCKLDQ